MEDFNPRGCISLDSRKILYLSFYFLFQSTRLYKPRLQQLRAGENPKAFQSTRLYKPRLQRLLVIKNIYLFQSTRLYKPRLSASASGFAEADFNPRGCISLDFSLSLIHTSRSDFNPRGCISLDDCFYLLGHLRYRFQSTRLYKPRHEQLLSIHLPSTNFNPRGCISLDPMPCPLPAWHRDFNPRGCISLDHPLACHCLG